MHSASIEDFTDLTPESEGTEWTTWLAVAPDTSPVRLTVFSEQISSVTEFRAAWRHDIELIQQCPHDGLPGVVATGDDRGAVFVATEADAIGTLSESLTSDRLTWDEVADLGWQAASVIQHLHNAGIPHGGLDQPAFRVSSQLRVSVVNTGFARWVLAARDPAAAADLNALQHGDLIGLGQFLEQLAATDLRDTPDASPIPPAWWDLIDDLKDSQAPGFPSTAREVQGRLGGILLAESGDSMSVRTDTTDTTRSGRRILDELLESDLPATTLSAAPSETRSMRHRTWRWLFLMALAAAICGAVWLLLVRRGLR